MLYIFEDQKVVGYQRLKPRDFDGLRRD